MRCLAFGLRQILTICIDVPIGGTLTAVKVLGQKLGLDLTAEPPKL